MDDLDLILWLFLAVGSAGAIVAFLFYGGAFLVQRVKMLWIEIEIKRAEAAAASGWRPVVARRCTLKIGGCQLKA